MSPEAETFIKNARREVKRREQSVAMHLSSGTKVTWQSVIERVAEQRVLTGSPVRTVTNLRDFLSKLKKIAVKPTDARWCSPTTKAAGLLQPAF